MGVLRYAFGTLAPRLGKSAAPQIFCGTSVGAINACALAARAEADDFGVSHLAARWESLRLEDIFRLGWGDLAYLKTCWKAPVGNMFAYPNIVDVLPDWKIVPTQLRVRDVVLWRALHDNVASGRVQAVTISATDLETGHTVVFVERAGEEPIQTTDAAVEWAHVRLRPQHALASAAIPIVFPTVRVAGRIFTDGSVRQSTPIAPAIRLGCGRVLVIGLRANPAILSARASGRQDVREQQTLSSPLYLFGKVLDALLLDHVENDLANLRRVNSALRALSPTLLSEQPLALALMAAGGALRPVRDLFIRPSQDLARLAGEVLMRPAVRGRLSGPAGYLMRRVGESAAAASEPSDLLSYLLFDTEYAHELMSLGERDARAHHAELEAFLADA